MATTCMMQISAISVYPICVRVIVCSFTMSIVYDRSSKLSTKLAVPKIYVNNSLFNPNAIKVISISRDPVKKALSA